ncbi:hypothetical protein ABZX56_30565 [Streptomyces parvulus]|uniref:hypothetical protein n=1 Tax=Streptomyces parvulus TaxID=146923 RepID=UPI00339EF766
MHDPEPPLPPPFMWACPACVTLLRVLADAVDLAEKHVCDDGALFAQIALCRHVAVDHADEVPAEHTDGCAICAHYARYPEDALLWAEHRVRGLFLPAGSARLM